MSEVLALFTILSLLYLFIYVVHQLLRSRSPAYERLLTELGLEVRPFQLRWYGEGRLARLIIKMGNWRHVRLWFVTGAYVSALLVIPSMVLLVKTLVETIQRKTGDQEGGEQQKQSIILQPVLPGVNMPVGDLGYYFITLLICSLVHEAGHAIAAVSEDVRVLGFGMNINFVLPVAYVNFPTDKLLSIRRCQRLRIFAAGIWHNIVFALFAYGLLFSTPLLVSPLFKSQEGVSVYAVKADSSLSNGPTPLEVYDVITGINNCPVRDKSDWRACIIKAIVNPAIGYCLDTKDVHLKKEEGSSCCSETDQRNSLCFSSPDKLTSCLPVRSLLEKNPPVCGAGNCSRHESTCFTPLLEFNSSRLIQVKREERKDFLFVGNPAEIYYDTDVTDYIPKTPLVNPFQLLPMRTEIIAHYAASFSGALAVLNVVPCFLLDGQHMTKVLVDILCSCYNNYIRTIITLTLTIVGTILLILNIIMGLWHFI
eukprot:TRINITY_DN4261_c0_g2_i1.p1 TRINITY_DN4261_c0_g2~~TRINITY_DN4261_c0_g2_i1.p1  ORF type:complete len:481 (-),score=127.64 TRINITY_DN4261_c0_g2_i1:5-1447(-)